MTASRRTAGRAPAPRRHRLRTALLTLAAALGLAVVGVLTAAHLEDDNTFCASCHTQPETTFVQRARAAPVDLASFHNTRSGAKNTTCIECHSGVGVPGRASAMSLGARDLATFISGHYANPAVLTVAIADTNCLKCHADITTKQGFDNHFHRFLPRWQKLDARAATCVSCHTGHDTAGNPQLSFLDQNHVLPVCQSCHNFVQRGG